MRWRPLAIGVVLAIGLAAGFWELAAVFATDPRVLAFDASVSAALQGLRSPLLTWFVIPITLAGDSPSVAVLTFALAWWLWREVRRTDAAYAALVVAMGGLLIWAFKDLLGRERPPVDGALIALPASFSFPSGHAMGSLVLGWVIAYLAYRTSIPTALKVRIAVACMLYALAVALSRVYLGVHWPSDLVASWLLGGALIALATGAYESFVVRSRAEGAG